MLLCTKGPACNVTCCAKHTSTWAQHAADRNALSRLQSLQSRAHLLLGAALDAMADVPDVPTTSAREAGPLLLEKKAPYLDVRTSEEFSREHVPGSINVPWFLNLTTRQVCATPIISAPEMQSHTSVNHLFVRRCNGLVTHTSSNCMPCDAARSHDIHQQTRSKT